MPDEHEQKPATDEHAATHHPVAEKRVEEIAEQLDIALPKTKLPVAVKVLGLLMVLGGLSVAGTLLTDVIVGGGLALDFARLIIGVALAVLGYGLIRRRLLALYGFGILAAVAAFFNPMSLILTGPIAIYLFLVREHFRPGILGQLFHRQGK